MLKRLVKKKYEIDQLNYWLTSIFRVLILIIALYYIFVFIFIVYKRIFYPFELEWIEGAYLDEVRWILAGHFPYSSPNILFLPTSKTPFFFYLSAFIAKFTGENFIAPRLISSLASIGIFTLLYLIVAKGTKKPLAGVCAAGLYASCYRFSGAWMDLAKADSLSLFLLLLGFFVGIRLNNNIGMLLSGMLFVVAYFTKQITLPTLIAFAPCSLLVTRGRTWLQWLVVLIVGFLVYNFFEYLSGGWFSFYTIRAVVSQSLVQNYFSFWEAFFSKFWPAFTLTLIFLGFVFSKTRFNNKWRENSWLNLFFSGALVLSSWSVFLKVWTYDNGYMSACIGVSLLVGLSYGEIIDYTYKPMNIDVKRKIFIKILWLGGSLLLLIQFSYLYYNPVAQIPDQRIYESGQNFIRYLENLPGEVFVFNHGYVGKQAGKETYLHSSPFSDAVNGIKTRQDSDAKVRKRIISEMLITALKQQIFNWVVLDKENFSWSPYYVFTRNIEETNSLVPLTGADSRPRILLIKNPIAKGGMLPITDPSYTPFFLEGWSPIQNWGRWAIGNKASLNIYLETKHDYYIYMDMQPFCVNDEPILKKMMISINEEYLGEQQFSSCERLTMTLDIPGKWIKKDKNILVYEFTPAMQNIKLESYRLKLYSIDFVQH